MLTQSNRTSGRLLLRRLCIAFALAAVCAGWWFLQGQPLWEHQRLSRASPAALLRLAHDHPQDAAVRLAAARALLHADRTQDAVTLLTMPAPNPGGCSPECEAALLGYLAQALIRLGKPADGRAAFLHAIQLDRYSLPAIFAEGLWLEDQSSWAPAAQAFGIVTKHDPADSDAWFQLGVAQARQQQYVAAAAALREANRLAPGKARYLVELGNVAAAQGDYYGGSAFYRRALRADPHSPSAQAGLAYTLSMGAQKRGEYAAARKSLLALERVAPARAQSLRGALELRFGDLQAARSDLLHAIQSGDKSPGVRFHLADVDRRLGLASESNRMVAEFHAARAAADEATRLEKQTAAAPTDVSLALRLAATYDRAGEQNKAIQQYRRILLLHPDSAQAAAALRVLERGPRPL